MFKIPAYTILTVLAVNLLATTCDLTMTWTSPILPKLYSFNPEINPLEGPITKEEESWIGSLINIGAIIGPFPFSFIAEKFGRKVALLANSIPFIVCFLISAFAQHIYYYYFARLLAGIGVGASCTLLPMYIAEISEDSYRGTLSVSLNIFWTLGSLIPYILGPFISILWFNVILSCIPAVFFIVFLTIAPETPYYLVKKENLNGAEQCLMKLRSKTKNEIGKDLENIQLCLETDQHGRITDLFKNLIYIKALIICVISIMFQQLSGINAVVFYTQFIFEQSGSELSAEISAIIIGLIFFLTSFIIPIFADSVGRNVFLMISAFGMCIAHITFGAYFYLKDSTPISTDAISWLPIVCLVGYITSFNLGFGTIPWTITSELFPSSVKSAAAALVTITTWITSFLVTKFFNDLNAALGISGTFWLFGGFCFIAFVFSYFFVPDTRGKSFKEIQEMLS